MKKIDTHLHLLYPDQLNYPWVAEAPPLQGKFSLEDYREAAKGCEIEGALFMEVDVAESQIADEVNLIRELAAKDSMILGIIAACRPESLNFEQSLDAIAGDHLKGLRRVLHTQADTLSQTILFRQNVAALANRDLPFDLCFAAKQLPIATELADACPKTRFVLDHCGVPGIAGGAFESWAKSITALAKREHVACKLSGIPTYCKPGEATAETLRPWVEHVIEAFGWDRVVWGGDWPVSTLNGTLLAWSDALDEILSEENTDNLTKLYSSNAQRIYRLA
jgi:predicted TIM-barrel fold metal-dependent hydrolase